jgi:tetratricopeptide (TPR) repeat protein
MSACERDGRHGRHVETCVLRYWQTNDQQYLAWASRGYLTQGELAAAAFLAQPLLTGAFYGDARTILSYVAMRYGAYPEAHWDAVIALAAHVIAGDQRAQASDLVALAQVAYQVGDFAASLADADDALELARRRRDPDTERAAYLAQAEALLGMGDGRGAADALTSVIQRTTTPCDRAWMRFKRGMLEMDMDRGALAVSELAAATEANRVCGNRDLATSIALNMAWLQRRDPVRALALLDEVVRAEGELVETLALRGYLAADHGDLDQADGYLARAQRLDPPDADWPWQLACARAEVAELQPGWIGDLLAEHHFRRATAIVAGLRATARARSAFLVASHRGPYDGLLAVLARHGRWRDALEVVLELDASDMLRATAADVVARSHVALDLEPSRPDPAPRLEDVVSAWRSRDLVVVVAPSPRSIGPGHERAYRLRVAHGQVTGEDVGPASLARAWADELFKRPEDGVAARGLRRMIVPPDPGAAVLHVLLVGALSKVPLPALRDEEGGVTIGRSPLVRVLGLRATGAASRGTGPAVIIADPMSDLRGAAEEGTAATAALGPGTRVFGSRTPFPATRARLWEVLDPDVLCIAGHVAERGRTRARALQLADGDVEPAEMVRRKLAPRIAVLSGCGSAAAMDEEGWGSIAAALLASGTAAVIATDRSVDDGESLAVMRELYAQPGWRTDPARALANVQQGLAARGAASTWAAFSVLVRPPEVPEVSAPDRRPQ